jgi:hypothetical protein
MAKPQVQFYPGYITGVTPIFAKVDFGASGAPTLGGSAGDVVGITSISGGAGASSTGVYTIVLDGPFQKFLGASAIFEVTATGIGASPVMGIKSFTASTGTLVVTFSDTASPSATDPASGEVLHLTLFMKSTIGV